MTDIKASILFLINISLELLVVALVYPIKIFENGTCNEYAHILFAGYLFTYKWRFNSDIKLMIGFEPNIYFKVMWAFFTPAVILVRTII